MESFSSTVGSIWFGSSRLEAKTRGLVRGRAVWCWLLLTALLAWEFSSNSCQAATIGLAWDQVSGATGYRIYAGQSPTFLRITETASTTATVNITNTTQIYVTAFNGSGESLPSNMISYSPPTVPPTNPPPSVPESPFGLRATLVSGNRVDLGWSVKDLSLPTQIEQSLDGAPFEVVATVPAGTLHWSFRVNKRKMYSWRCRACNNVGCSAASNSVIFSSQ